MPEIIRSYEQRKDAYKEINILFFRYTNNSCNSCLNYYLFEILTLQEEIGKEHVWIFSAYPDDRGSPIQLRNESRNDEVRSKETVSLVTNYKKAARHSYLNFLAANILNCL